VTNFINISEALKYYKNNNLESKKLFKNKKDICKNKFYTIKKWAEIVLHQKNSKTYTFTLRHIVVISVIMFFLMGIATSASLLKYSSQPVNVLYFLSVSLLFPLIGIFLSIFSFIEITTSKHTIMIDFLPLYWLYKLFKKEKTYAISIPQKLLKSYILYISQYISISFYLGILSGLIFIISFSDVVFGWSSTLHISANELHKIMEYISYPWHNLFPWAVPSIELIDKSRFFNLAKWNPNDVLLVGQWWKFLAMTIIFYGIFLRVIFILPFKFYYQKIEKDIILQNYEVLSLLRKICEPVIETNTQKEENPLVYDENAETIAKKHNYDYAILWSIDEDIEKIMQRFSINSKNIIVIYPSDSFNKITEKLVSVKGDAIFIVKGWDSPITELTDTIKELSNKSKQIDILPIGFKEDNYIPTNDFIEIWSSKIKYLHIPKTGVIQ